MPFAIENLATAVLTVFALALTLIGFRAWRHSRNDKVLLLSIGFLLFFVKGVALSAGLFLVPDWDRMLLATVVGDLLVLGVFYLAVLR